MFEQSSAVVLFSGGQDSTTCLAYALKCFDKVYPMGVAYGQRHEVEMAQRQVVLRGLTDVFPLWADKMAQDTVLDMRFIAQLGQTAMTEDRAIVLQENGLPNTFVPGRNLIFLSAAAALAYRVNASQILTGVCETDYSGYPDCRNETMRAMQEALCLALAQHVEVVTPLMWRDKAQTWQMAYDLGGDALIHLIINDTHTCYLGNRENKHVWGYGCGQCPACLLREKGWHTWQESRA